ncbi:hypothetical protein [Nostoc sp.]
MLGAFDAVSGSGAFIFTQHSALSTHDSALMTQHCLTVLILLYDKQQAS